MQTVVNDDGAVIARLHQCPFKIREYDRVPQRNKAFRTVEEMLADAVDRSAEIGPDRFVMVAWGYVSRRFVDPVGMLRLKNGREVEFSFFNQGREDYDAMQRARKVLHTQDWEQVALDTVNAKLRDKPESVWSRNLVVVPYSGEREDAVKALSLVLAI